MPAMRKGAASACLFVWRRRVAWLVLTAVVLGDTAFWLLHPYRAGDVPQLLLLGWLDSKGTGWRRSESFLVLPSDAAGERVFLDPLGDVGAEAFDEAQYLVSATHAGWRTGLWSPCLRFESGDVRVIDLGFRGGAPLLGPRVVGLEALRWYESQPGASEPDRASREALVKAARDGVIRRSVLWPGAIHDAAMAGLSLLWTVLTGSHVWRQMRKLMFARSRRRLRERGLCGKCGYPLIGQRFKRCPECGAEFDVQ